MEKAKKTDRRSYTIKKSLRSYLLASIVTMAVMNINGMIDAILMGQILGPGSLSSIQTSMPVISLIACIGLLVTNGAGLILPEVIGKRDYDASNRVFSVCLIANLVVGAILGVCSGPLSRLLSGALCIDKTLLEGTQTYTMVLLAGAVVLLVQNDVSILVDVMGSPVTVTISMTASVLVNLVCDILYTKVFRLGIAGAALATLTGALVSVLVFARYFLKNKKAIHLKWNISQAVPTFLRVVQKSIPGVVSALGTMLLTILCNSFVQKALGADGMFAMTIGYMLVSMGSMISGGIGSSFMGIGGMLHTQEDYTGFSMLVKRGMRLSLAVACAINLLAWLVPGPIAVLFGAKTDVLIDITKSALPIVSVFVLAVSIITPLSVVYQVNSYFLLATLSSLSLLASAGLGFVVAQFLFKPAQIWLAFPIAAVISVAFVLAAGIVTRRKLKVKTERVTLIQKPDGENAPRLDVSVSCSREGITNGLSNLKDFLGRITTQEKKVIVMHCLEELLINIAVFTGKKKQQFFDLLVRKEDNDLYVYVKDSGPPFDPVNCVEEDWKTGLIILHHYAKDMSYNYSFGLNMTFFKFPLEEAGSQDSEFDTVNS